MHQVTGKYFYLNFVYRVQSKEILFSNTNLSCYTAHSQGFSTWQHLTDSMVTIKVAGVPNMRPRIVSSREMIRTRHLSSAQLVLHAPYLYGKY